MSDAYTTLDKLRGFLEINGDGLPSQEQWEKIVDLIKFKEPEMDLKDKDIGVEEILKDWKERPNTDLYGPLYPTPNDLTLPKGPGDWPTSPFIYCGGASEIASINSKLDEDWEIGDDGNLTYVGDVRLSNSLDVDDVMGLDSSHADSLGSKLLDVDSVSVEYKIVDDEAPHDRDDQSG